MGMDRSAKIVVAWFLLLIPVTVVFAQTQNPPLDQAFAQSKIFNVPAVITAGEAFAIGFRVRNNGEATTYTRVTFDLPSDILLATAPQECFARYDAEARRWVFEGSLGKGWERQCIVNLIALRNASNRASFSLTINTPPSRWTGDVAAVNIITPPAPGMITIGGQYHITRIGLGVLGFLALLVIAIGLAKWSTKDISTTTGWFSSRQRAVSAAIGAVISLGFLTIFGYMAWDDRRSLTIFRETTCEVIDSTLKFVHSSPTRTPPFSQRNITRGAYKPMFSLNYTLDGVKRQSLGFSTDSRLDYSTAAVTEIMDAYIHGKTVPCWVDPDDLQRVVLLRGFGGAYFFATFPLLLLGVSFWLWPKKPQH